MYRDIVGCQEDVELGEVLVEGRSLRMYQQLKWPERIAPGHSRHKLLLFEFEGQQSAIKVYELSEAKDRRAFLREAKLLKELSKVIGYKLGQPQPPQPPPLLMPPQTPNTVSQNCINYYFCTPEASEHHRPRGCLYRNKRRHRCHDSVRPDPLVQWRYPFHVAGPRRESSAFSLQR